jgi:hypothetical protein
MQQIKAEIILTHLILAKKTFSQPSMPEVRSRHVGNNLNTFIDLLQLSGTSEKHRKRFFTLKNQVLVRKGHLFHHSDKYDVLNF